jgi:IS1 family transposase
MEEETIDDKTLMQKYLISQSQLSNLIVSKQETDLKIRVLEEKFAAEVLQHEQDLKDSKADIDYLTNQNKDLKIALSSLQSNIEHSDNTLESKFQELSMLYEKNVYNISSNQNYILQLESQNTALTQKIENLEKTNAKLQGKKRIIMDENNNLRAKNNELLESLEKITKEAEKIIIDCVKKEDSRKNQQDEYMSIVKKHSILEKKYKDLLQTYEKLEKDMVSKNDRINSIRSSKLIIDNKLKEEEKKNEELTKKIKLFESSFRNQRKLDSSEITQIQIEQDLKLAESERKLKVLADKIDPLIKKNSQLEKLIEK